MVTVNHRLYKPIGFVLLAIALVNFMFLIYPFADTVVVFRRCVGYWIFVIFVGVAILGFIPITAYTAYAIYWLRRQKVKQQASQMQGPSAPCAPDVIAKKVGISVGISILVLLSFMSIILTAIAGSYHGSSISIRTAGQFNIIFRGNVSINRDDHLVPHISANSVDDVLFAQGIAHSQDRLFQLDFYKRMALGSLATMQGKKEAIHSDIFFRTLNLNQSAYDTWSSLDAKYQSALTSYSDGVNHYVRSLRNNQKPFEYQVELESEFSDGFWTPQTSLAILKMFQFVMSGNMESELIRFYLATNIQLNITRVMDLVPMVRYDAPTTWTAEDLYIPPPLVPDRLSAELKKFEDDKTNAEKLQEYFGIVPKQPSSSSVPDGTAKAKKPSSLSKLVKMWEPTHHWLKHGKAFVENTFGTVNFATYSGGELFEETTLASSFGFPFRHQAPTVLYLNHLKQMDALENAATGVEGTGLSIPGVPGLMTGRTLFYTWSVAPMQSDVMDFYVLKDFDESGDSYEYENAQKNYTMRYETIKVRGGKTREIVCRDSVHGPVLSDSWEEFTNLDERPNSVKGMRMALRWTGFESSNDKTLSFFIDSWRQSDYNSFETVAYKFSVPAMNVFFGDRNGDPAGGFVAVGLVPNRRAHHTGLLPVTGVDGSSTWNGFKDLAAINPNVYVSLMINAGNRIVPPGFDFDLGYDFEESWRFEILQRSLIEEYTVSESNGSSVRPITSSFAKSVMNSKESGLLYALTPALLETKKRIDEGTVTLTKSSVVKKITNLLDWDGQMSSGSGSGASMLGWYEELTKLGRWESQIEKFHRPQFIVRTLAPRQNRTIELLGLSSEPSADLLERNDERCRRGLVDLYKISETNAANAAYPCSEYVAASLSAASSKSVGSSNRVSFDNAVMAKTTYKCVCDRFLKQTGGGAMSLNSVLPHYQQVSYYASIYQNDEHKFRIPLSPDGNHWNKKKYDKYLREISVNENGFWVPMHSSGTGYPIIESLQLLSA